jgi:thermitase
MKRRLSLLLAVSLIVCTGFSIPVAVESKGTQESSQMYDKARFKHRKPKKVKFEKSEKEILNEIEDLTEENGEEAAELLNEVDDNQKLYSYALKSTLEKCYGDVEQYEEQIEELKEYIMDSDGQEIIADYEAAQAERDKADTLDYSTDGVIVAFEPDIEEKYMEEVAEEQFGELESTNIIGEVDVTGMSDEKKEQIQEVDKLQEDVVANVDISMGQTVEEAIEMYSQYENVKYVEPNYLSEPMGLTVDTLSNEQWYLDRINIQPGWHALQVPGSISETYIAVIDTGIETTHPDLKNVYLKNKSVDITRSDYPRLCDLGKKSYALGSMGGHGTNVSGLAVAEANNGKGIAGVAAGGDPSAFRLMAIKGVPNDRSDGRMPINYMIEAIYYAVRNGADVINISFAGPEYSQPLYDALKYANNAGIPVVCAAGNDNSNKKYYPASYDLPNVISVAGIDKNDKKVDSSNFGSMIDIAAPGTLLRTTALNGEYLLKGGTSNAAPIVTGVIASMKAITLGEIGTKEIEKILSESGIRINSTVLGSGLIDAGCAIQAAKYLRLKTEKVNTFSAIETTTKGTIKLNWRTGSTCAEGYIISRATSENGTYSRIKTITNYNTSTFTDTSLTSGKTYYYRIRGYIKNVEAAKRYSQFSTIKSAKSK